MGIILIQKVNQQSNISKIWAFLKISVIFNFKAFEYIINNLYGNLKTKKERIEIHCILIIQYPLKSDKGTNHLIIQNYY